MDTRRAIMAFLLAACVVMTSLSLGVHRADDLPRAKMRVGVYDNRAVAIAYFHSDQNRASMAAWKDKHDAATKAGDTDRVARIEKAMDRMQWLAHRQGFGRASVDEAMASIKDKLIEVANKADVNLIVCNPDYLDPTAIERVDLTDEIVALFHPKEETLKTVEAMKSVTPIQIDYDFEE